MPGIQPGISHMHPYVFFCYEAFYAFLPLAAGTTVLQSACASFIR